MGLYSYYSMCSSSPLPRYCKRVYQPNSATSDIFFTLLRIYLQPTAPASSRSPNAPSSNNSASALLEPALQLISRHSPRLDPVETLKILPPLVQAQDLKEFLIEALRAPKFDVRVIREISKSRNQESATRLMALEERRVKVTDSRMYVLLHRPEIFILITCPDAHNVIRESAIV